jgi:hypothetical protein
MQQTEQAWLVAYLNPDGRYQLGIFSERSPTVLGGTWTASVASGRGRNYEEGRRDLLVWIERHLPVEVARYGEDDVRKAKGLKPRRGSDGRRRKVSGAQVLSAVSAIGMCVSPRRVR